MKTCEKNGQQIAVVTSEEKIIIDTNSALDFIAMVQYETKCDRIVLNKEAIADEFFVLSNRMAGDILQKFVNYRTKLAVYGDYSHYDSKPLKDFIYESNKGRHIFFATNPQEAVERLAAAN